MAFSAVRAAALWGRVKLTVHFRDSDSPFWGLWQGTILVQGEERRLLVRPLLVSWLCAALRVPTSAGAAL